MISSSITNSIKNNWIKWLLALILAGGGIIVLLRADQTSQETAVLIPVIPENIPIGYTITDPDIKPVEIFIRGSERKIKLATDSKLQYRLDLSQTSPGFNSFPIKIEKILMPKGITIVKVNPTLLTLTLEREIEKEIPISITVTGKPASRYYITEIKIIPAQAVLRGPESILSPLKKIITKPVDIGGVGESFKKEIAFELSKGLHVISPKENMFVEFIVNEKITTKQLNNLPVIIKNTRYKYTIHPELISIQIKGTFTVLEKIEKGDNIKVYLNFRGLKPGIYVRRAEIILPVKTTLISVEPEYFTVTISKK